MLSASWSPPLFWGMVHSVVEDDGVVVEGWAVVAVEAVVGVL